MKLIIGLGNPGPEYLNSRHNLGFMVLDSLHAHYEFENWKSKFDGTYASKRFGSEKIILVKLLLAKVQRWVQILQLFVGLELAKTHLLEQGQS